MRWKYALTSVLGLALYIESLSSHRYAQETNIGRHTSGRVRLGSTGFNVERHQSTAGPNGSHCSSTRSSQIKQYRPEQDVSAYSTPAGNSSLQIITDKTFRIRSSCQQIFPWTPVPNWTKKQSNCRTVDTTGKDTQLTASTIIQTHLTKHIFLTSQTHQGLYLSRTASTLRTASWAITHILSAIRSPPPCREASQSQHRNQTDTISKQAGSPNGKKKRHTFHTISSQEFQIPNARSNEC